MTFENHLLKGGLFGLIFTSTWLLVEGTYVSFDAGGVPMWSVPFGLGVAAPLVVVGSLVLGLVVAGWARVQRSQTPIERIVSEAKRWLWGGMPGERARRSAWFLATPFLLGAWFGIGLVAGKLVLSAVKTTSLAILLNSGIALVSAIGLFLLAPLVVVPLEGVMLAVGQLIKRGPLPPIYILGALGLGAVAGLVGLWLVLPDVMPHLPWNFVLGPIVGLLASSSALSVTGTSKRRTRLMTSGLFAAIVGLGLVTAYMPASWSKARAVFVDQTSIASAWYGFLDKKLDYDGDGALHLFGENDCAPHDASLSPYRGEIVGNGIDENCSGADLVVDREAFVTGKTSYPRPKGVVKKPHIILVTTDALSYDHTSLGGYHRDTTPELAKWAERATSFESAFSLSSSTRLTMPGLVTGKFSSMVRMNNRRIHPYPYHPSVPTMASVLKAEGYKTVHIPGDDYFHKHRWKGYTRGFDVVDQDAYNKAKDKRHTAPSLNEAAIQRIKDHRDGKPLFMWIHYFDHHEPYELPKGERWFDGNKEVDRYDNELRFTDRYWGELFRTIEKTWDKDEYIVIFTADHGEAFDKKHPKGRRHDFTLDTQVLHVPFIVQGPKQRGEKFEGLVSHPDVLATVANIVGRKPEKDWVGESLVPVLFEGKPIQKDAIFSLFYIPEAVKRGEDGFWKIGVRTSDYYYWEDLKKGSRLLVDWKNDPLEDHDLSKELPEVFEIYRYVAAQKLEWLREREEALTKFRKKQKKN